MPAARRRPARPATDEPAADEPADDESAVDDLAASLRISIARLARLLRQQDHSGLSPAMATALASVWREGPVTMGRLAALEQITPPTVTKLVEKLEARGLVERLPDPDDRRVCRVAVTPAGYTELDAIRTRRTEWLSAQLRALPAADLARLHDVVEVLDHLVRPPDPSPSPSGPPPSGPPPSGPPEPTPPEPSPR